MNYKELLIKYIAHVVDCEGSNFISSVRTDQGKNLVLFSEEEKQELLTLSQKNDEQIFEIERTQGIIQYSIIENGINKRIAPPFDFNKQASI